MTVAVREIDVRHVDMLDLRSEFRLYRDEVRAAIDCVLDSQQFIGGPQVERLESALAELCGTAHAVAVGSGTDALLCALMAHGVGPGDEVIVPSFTFFATAGSVARLGAKPIFVDIDAQTFNLDPKKIEAAVTKQTRAIIAVHLYGQCADMDALRAIADRAKIVLIEDAAQAVGAQDKGRRACSLGDSACLSFYPTKNLGGFGEGGMVLTNDACLAATARQLRNHGQSAQYKHDRIGGNFRLDSLKAAVLLVKLSYWEEFTRRRQANAALYDQLLADSAVRTPFCRPDVVHVYHQYSVCCEDRDGLAAYLKGRGIGTAIYYPIPLHLQKCFSYLGYGLGDLPVSELAARSVLSLPCHPMLSEADIRYVAMQIRAYERGGVSKDVAAARR